MENFPVRVMAQTCGIIIQQFKAMPIYDFDLCIQSTTRGPVLGSMCIAEYVICVIQNWICAVFCGLHLVMLIKIVRDKSAMVDNELREKIWNMKIIKQLVYIRHTPSPDDERAFFYPSNSQTDRIEIVVVRFLFCWFSFFFSFVAEIFSGYRAARVTFIGAFLIHANAILTALSIYLYLIDQTFREFPTFADS